MGETWLISLSIIGIIAAYGLIDASEPFDSRESSGGHHGHHESHDNTPRPSMRSRPPMGGSSGMAGSGTGSGRGPMGGRAPMGGSGIGSGRGSMGGRGIGSGRGSMGGSGIGSGIGPMGGRPSMGPRMPIGSGRGPFGRRGPMSGPGSGHDGKSKIPDSSSSGGDDRPFFPGDRRFNLDDSPNDFTPWFLRRRAFPSSFYPEFATPPFSPTPFFPRSSFGFPFQRPQYPSPWGWNSWNANPNHWLWGSSRRSSWSPFFGQRWEDSLTDSSFPDFLSLRSPQLPAEQLDRSSIWGDDSFDGGINRDASRESSWGLSQSRSSSWPWGFSDFRQTPFRSSARQYDDHDHRGSWGHSGHWSGRHSGWGHHSSHESGEGHHWGHWDSPARVARPDSWGGSWARSIGYEGRNFNDRSAINPFNSWFGRQAAAGTVTPPPVTVSTDSIPVGPIMAGDDKS